MRIFKSKLKEFDGEIKLKLSRKRLLLTDSVKYLGVKIDGNLSWKSHIHCGPKKTVPQNEFTLTFEALKIKAQNIACVFSNQF